MVSGRIVKALSGFYEVMTDEETPRRIVCRARGIFKHKKKEMTPLVGDWVKVDIQADQTGTVMEIADRRSQLIRPPVANVEQAVLVFSVKQPHFQSTLLDKFLLFIEAEGLEPILVLSKTDLLVDDASMRVEVETAVAMYRNIGYQVFELGEGTEDRARLEALQTALTGRINVLAGQSGVGKSSLFNRLITNGQMQTGEVSDRLGRGKHTTRHVELLELEQGGWLIDTPGFSQLDLSLLEVEQITQGYREFVETQDGCKYRGCSHLHEPGCAVKAKVETNEISNLRYDSYVQWMKEWNEQKRRGFK